MIIAFSGLDGSGKTTQLDLAADYLRKKGITCRRRHAIRDSLAYFLTHRMLGRVSPGSRESLEKGLRRGGNKVMFPVLSAAKKFFLLLDAVYFRLRYGYYRWSKKKDDPLRQVFLR